VLSYKYRGPRTERSNVGTILISAVSLPNEFAMTVSVPSKISNLLLISRFIRARDRGPRSRRVPVLRRSMATMRWPVVRRCPVTAECLGPRLVELRIGLDVGPVVAFQYPEISTGRIQSSLPWLLHFGTRAARAAQNRGHKRVRHCRHAPFPPKREAADPQAFAVHQPSSSPHGTARRETGPKWIALALDPFSRSRPRPLFALLP
jgi:hypothetical protein